MARQNIATTFSNLRFPLMIGVVMIHCSISDTGNLVMDYVSKLFSEILPIFCVPIFFFISGYFFFANVSEFSVQVYKEKVRRRIRTLLVPYVCANLFMIFCYACAHYFIPQYINPENFNVLQYSFKDFFRAFWNIYGYPICYPLWFIRNLFIIVLCSPLFYLGLKQNLVIKFTVLLSLVSFRFFFDASFLIGPIYFYLGAMFSRVDVYNFLQRFNKKYYFIILTLVALVLIYLNFIESISYLLALQRFTTSILVMRLAYLLSINTGAIKSTIWYSAFFLYLYHAFPIFVIKALLFKVVAPSDSISFIATYILLIIISITSCILAYLLLNKCTPSFLALLTGGRNKSLKIKS